MNHLKNRQEVPEMEKWDLTDIYANQEAWEADYASVEKMAQELKSYDGNITDGATMYQFLSKQEEMVAIFNNVYVYAMLHVDLDTREQASQALLDKGRSLAVKLNEATSFFSPFLMSLEKYTLDQYMSEEPRLSYFKDDLYDTYRYKDHVLSKENEELLSQLGETFSAPRNTFGMINNADIKFGNVTDDDGNEVELTRGMYSKLIEDENREKRKEAYKSYYQPYVQMKNSIASTLSAAIKNNVTLSKVRHYPSALEKSLFANKIPKEVYENLIDTARKNLSTMHRYTQLRKDILGVDELRQYDLNVPLVSGVKEDISYEEAYATMLEALAPLGEDYVQTVKEMKGSRYIDVRETPGKRSGAYNLGLYGVHPFILLNHQDDLDSLFTLTHEMGHAMHSHYSNKHQPRITASYEIFVAEVASTVNEVLLIHHLLDEAKDQEYRKYLLNHFIDQFKGTFFTQVMFAEFEKKTHELAENGEPLNTETFNDIYEDLFKTYHGDALTIEEETKYGWSRIPHFYRPFYVYQYATGFAAAIHIANAILKGDKDTLNAYLSFLKSGSSDYPIELLKKTGVDLTTPEPIENALGVFEDLVQEFATL
ncbi:oligoendopeptidase F [Texcoconibacillus texcoconensis]|uniref:Oligopeptidase F n=1 Tax=Texcoconibacillus texcoconensis TaxID=1095777 RepID=A0A840QL08_9BACI|nr:oligoendopeptidase F [Texcoconibacillus texcoconensis]MBB5171881.1 oligoendopeptidase F [Texcoconibacillus texcoconensis]